MKFGLYLEQNLNKEWKDKYVEYKRLKKIIKELSKKNIAGPTSSGVKMGLSLSTPAPTNAAAMPDMTIDSDDDAANSDDDMGKTKTVHTQEMFFQILESNMKTVEEFTQKQVAQIRDALQSADQSISGAPKGEIPIGVKEAVDAIGAKFLTLEKYVNLNFTGFRKIMKKHDKNLPNPCSAFYLGRLHNQAWVRGDYSDIIVNMSRIYAAIRGDKVAEDKGGASQEFLRSTTKFWVRPDHVSAIKYMVSRELPVFLQKTSTGRSDAQLVNSVYLDNASLELYHGRLDKTPGAIALRLRWYGTGEPELVFVERKTHRDSWTGEVSVKERFTITPDEVPDLLNGKFPRLKKIEEMRAKGRPEKEIADWDVLVTEICQAINSKQLIPTMRSQYMRTAFQIPFDATVRISLDTNLTMVYERDEGVENRDRWYRDPSIQIPGTEITRFPHAVLEVKLEIADGNTKPQWVDDMLNSGMCMDVHKFSKFIHGCAVLMQDDVRAVPYWVDDPSLKASIEESGGGALLLEDGERLDANKAYGQLLPYGEIAQARRATVQNQQAGELDPLSFGVVQGGDGGPSYEDLLNDDYDCCYDSCINPGSPDLITPSQKMEPKQFFANERTFIHWLHNAVMLASISSGILALAERDTMAEVYALCLLPISFSLAAYALFTFRWRATRIAGRFPVRWDDPFGPVILGCAMLLCLCVFFVFQLEATFGTSGGATRF